MKVWEGCTLPAFNSLLGVQWTKLFTLQMGDHDARGQQETCSSFQTSQRHCSSSEFSQQHIHFSTPSKL